MDVLAMRHEGSECVDRIRNQKAQFVCGVVIEERAYEAPPFQLPLFGAPEHGGLVAPLAGLSRSRGYAVARGCVYHSVRLDFTMETRSLYMCFLFSALTSVYAIAVSSFAVISLSFPRSVYTTFRFGPLPAFFLLSSAKLSSFTEAKLNFVHFRGTVIFFPIKILIYILQFSLTFCFKYLN